MKKTNFNKEINELLDNFDFIKVHKVMDFMNWGWADPNNNYSIPKISDLKNCAEKLLKDVISQGLKEKQDWFCATGGFEAEFNYKRKNFSLKFVLVDFWIDL